MKTKLLFLAMLLTLGLPALWGQTKIKDGTVTGSGALPNSNAILELESNNRGLLLPRVPLTSTTAATPLSAFVAGMVVYNTATAGSGLTAVSPGYYYSDGTSWVRLAAAGTIPLSSLVAAVSTNNIDNTNFAQVWNWSTAAAETPFTLTGNALTTGSLLRLTSSSTGRSGTNGLLHVANTGAATTGMLASFRGNSADSGFNILNNGSVGVGTNSPNATALVELMSTSKGFLIPRLTTAQRDAIGGPAIGLQIFNSDVNCLEYWNGTQWISMCGGTANGTANPDCASRKLYGVYQVGSATTGSNYVVIPVTVIKAGSWSATTTTANGLSFSGSGTFAAPGTDSIRLYATAGAIPVANGTFTYILTLGSSTCNFSIVYNSLPGCTEPSPALAGTTVCTILQGSSRTFGVSGGTTNTTSITYSITPTTGVSAPTGTVTGGATPAITFSNIGNYTITFTARNSSSACNESSISTSQSFQVVTGPAAPSSTYCNTGRFGPAVFTNRQYATTIGGVSITTTWTKNGTADTSVYSYGFCGFASPPAVQFNSETPASTKPTSNTFRYNQPVSNIQLITGIDGAGQGLVITAKNGSTDVTSQLILTPLSNNCSQFTQTGCTTFTITSQGLIAGGFIIGGVYFTEFTVAAIGGGGTTAGTDGQFDLSYCQAVTNACQTPGAITTSYSPATNTTLGGTITATLSGGTPKTSNFSWTTTTLCGTYTGTTSGSNASTATFTSSSYAVIAVTYSVSNAGSGSCLPATTTKTDTLSFFNASPTAPTTISSYSSATVYPYTFSNGGTGITVTNSVTSGTISAFSNQCINFPSGNIYTYLNSTTPSTTYTFTQPVYNVQVASWEYNANDGSEGLAVYAYLCNKLVPVSLNLVTQANGGGSCNNFFAVSATADGGMQVRNTGSNNNSGVAFTITSSVPYDKLVVTRVGGTAGGVSHYLLYNQASAANDCPVPTTPALTINPSSKSANLGSNITVTASATPATSYSWSVATICGTYTGTTSGTGATATLTSSSYATVAITYTATNTGSCTTTQTAKTDTVSFFNAAPVAATTINTYTGPTYPYNINNGGSAVTVNYAATPLSGTTTTTAMGNIPSCGIPFNFGTAVLFNGGGGSSGGFGGATYTFSKPVYNVQCITWGNDSTDNREGIIVQAYLCNVLVPVTLTPITNANGGGTCNSSFISTSNAGVGSIRTLGSGITGAAVAFTIVASRPYDKLILYRDGNASTGANAHMLAFDNASTSEDCVKPTATVTYSTKTPALGASVTTTVSGSNYTSATWVATTLSGTYTGTTSGTGNATLTSTTKAAIRVVYTFTNAGSNCITNTTTIVDTVLFNNLSQYLVGRISGTVTVAAGATVPFTQVAARTLAVSNGVVTLKAGKTYRLFAELRTEGAGSSLGGNYISYQWVNASGTKLNSTNIGIAVGASQANSEGDVPAGGIYTVGASDETVRVQAFNSIFATGSNAVSGGSAMVIEEIVAASGFVQAVSTSDQTVAAGTAINWAQQATRGSVTVSGSTITLKAGKTYRLFAALRKNYDINNVTLSYQFTPSGSNSLLSGTVPAFAIGAGITSPYSGQPGAYGIYTVGASDETISVRVIGIQGTNAMTLSSADGQNVLIVDEIPAGKGYIVGTKTLNNHQTAVAASTDITWQVTSASGGGLSLSSANITLPAISTYSLYGNLRQVVSSGTSGTWMTYNWTNSANVALPNSNVGLSTAPDINNSFNNVAAKAVYITGTASEVVKLRTQSVGGPTPTILSSGDGMSGFMIVQLD